MRIGRGEGTRYRSLLSSILLILDFSSRLKWYRKIPAATATFKESVPRFMGIVIRRSHAATYCGSRPCASPPNSRPNRPGRAAGTAARRLRRARSRPVARTTHRAAPQVPHQVVRVDDRQAQDRPHRNPHRLPPERVVALLAEQHRVRSEAGRQAEDRPDVLDVADVRAITSVEPLAVLRNDVVDRLSRLRRPQAMTPEWNFIPSTCSITPCGAT